MKLKFDSNLGYQTDAVNSVTALFDGQNGMIQSFTVSGQATLDGGGVGNKIDISNEDILDNLRGVQAYHKLAPSESLNSLDFNIEMETGTGKTYVYLKTIFELNQKYKFTKFIIVVPSIAIKEGVSKTIKITKEHFKELYGNVIYDHFVYDSKKLELVRNFATSANIQIMIINIDAFNKKDNNIVYVEQDKLSGYRPIDLIAETNPVVIIDEPQSVMGTKGEEAIKNLNPLCTLRYSATHKEIQNLVYKLDAVDASDQKLVKRIVVDGIVSKGYHNAAYLKLISVNNTKSPITAKIEIDAKVKGGKTKRKTVTVKQGSDLSEAKLGNRDVYNGYVVDEIYCEEGNEFVSFTQKNDYLRIGVPIGDVDDLKIKREQIKHTIIEHLDKELEFSLSGKKIKVLSLFFIDKVANYRQYDEDGNPFNGPYADIFEEEYKKAIQNPKYSTLYKDIDLELSAEEVHNGYFSKDKKGKFKDTRETKSGKIRASKDDETTFNLIMRDKEKLLSLDSNLKFIFSHSALREGWDNPNVFQICTLNETRSTMKKRQEIGRGLRLCVDENGERLHDDNINVLTVIANESYEEFAQNLQEEIEEDLNIKFGTIKKTAFSHIMWTNPKGIKEPLGSQHSNEIFKHFKLMNYIDKDGKIQDALKVALDKGTVDIPERYKEIKTDIIDTIAKPAGDGVPVINRNCKRKVEVNKQVFLGDDFKEFWNRIKHKTTYAVEYDTNELITKSVDAMDEYLNISSPKLLFTKSGLKIDATGVKPDGNGFIKTAYSEVDEIALPDIVTYLQNETDLTRRTIVEILKRSDTLDQFKKNPQEYMQQTAKLINRVLGLMIVDGVKYTKIDDFYSQELFKNEEFYGYLKKNLIQSKHSIYDYVKYDSKVECEFARKLENNPDVKLYVKLPQWFKIKTPIGNYNPDWAVMFERENEEEKLYFVVETKGNIDYAGLRPDEKAKIDCGTKHFEAIHTNVELKVAKDFDEFRDQVEG